MPKKDYKSILDNMEIVERVDLELRNLYTKYGYSRFKMGKFEEYDLYSGTRDFIPTEDIITVTGQKGKLLALRPDLTLSIVKYFRPEEKSMEKLFYSENIYRAKKDGTYSELRQTGLELLGDLNEEEVSRVVLLAALSLKTICNDFVLDISHMGLLQEIVSSVPQEGKEDVLLAISQKNTSAIEKLGQEYSISLEEINTIKAIATLYGNYKDALPRLKKMPLTTKGKEYLLEIEKVCKFLAANKVGSKVNIDFSIVNNMNYYSGILFKGYILGIYSGILSGGRYDGVMNHMGKKGGAIGFALYLDELRNLEMESPEAENQNNELDQYINIALPKGRLGSKIYDLFDKCGYSCKEIKEDNRKLVFENKRKKVRFFWVKPADVTVYVERGTADIGACGSDIIGEYTPDVYEVLDLKKGRCTMAVAGKKDFKDDTSKTLRVATKFPNIARGYFERESRNIDIIELHGSIELAPVLNMSDVIVDIVETGKTLRENNLEVIKEILPITTGLIVNKSSFRFKNQRIMELLKKLELEV